MLETHPAKQAETKGEIEKSFVRDAEYDECRRELQEDDHQAMNVMLVRLERMQLRYKE